MANINWHKGFVSAMKLELLADKDRLTFNDEYLLSGGSKRIDLLIIKNESAEKMHRLVGAVFERYNIYEYKNPTDSMTFGDFFKTLSYVCTYLEENKEHDRYKLNEYTMTLIRDTYPKSLFGELKKNGIEPKQVSEGVYIIEERMPFKTQILVTSRMDEDYTWLRALTKNPSIEKLRGIVNKTESLTPDSKKDADTVMNVFTDVNEEYMIGLRENEEEKHMCEAVNRLFADETEKYRKESKEKDKIIEEINAKLDAQGSLVESMKKQMAEKEKALTGLDKTISEKDRKLSENEVTIAQLLSKINTLEAQLKA